MTLLSDAAVLRHLDYGSVVIDPFDPRRLNTDSYDLELGPFFWRYDRMLQRNPSEMERGKGFTLVDAREDKGIWLAPGERVLGHSVEIAGGTIGQKPNPHYNEAIEPLTKMAGFGDTPKEVPVAVTSHLQATSTAGRHGLTVCECAGWGDVGFVNIWTFEITNKLFDRMWLPVGAIVAQVAFSQVEVPTAEYGAKGGHTYVLDTLEPEEIRAKWTPDNMLPKAMKVRGKWKEQTWKKR
jgi:dCTP deaminase